MRNLGRIGVLIDELLRFNIEPFCSDVYGDHRRPQTQAEICRNMGIYCGFRAVAARGKYLGLILLGNENPIPCHNSLRPSDAYMRR